MYIKKPIDEKKCIVCNKLYLPDNVLSKYCSQECKRNKNISNYLEKNPDPFNIRNNLSAGTMGAVNEHIIIVDLLRKGYAVFRAVSPSCSCDLAVLKDKKLYRVEVTSGWRGVTGKNYANKHNSENYDIFAVVFSDGSIEYKGLPENNSPIIAGSGGEPKE